jgi:DNA-binding response OmpR family regulator
MMEELSRQELEDLNELLKQQLQALTGSSKELGVLIALRHGMTHRLAIILYILCKRAPAVISRTSLHSTFYGDRPDGGPEPRIFTVYITRLRSILKRLGAKGKIEAVWNAGWRASPELVAWVNQLYEDNIPQEE